MKKWEDGSSTPTGKKMNGGGQACAFGPTAGRSCGKDNLPRGFGCVSEGLKMERRSGAEASTSPKELHGNVMRRRSMSIWTLFLLRGYRFFWEVI